MTNNPLKLVDLITPDNGLVRGLVSIKDTDASELSIDEQVAVFEAKSFEHIDFIFFRRFSDGRSAQISAYVVDNSDERMDEKALAELHQQVWLHGTVPLLYISWPTRIDVLSCARGPDFWGFEEDDCRYNPAKSFEATLLETASEINKELQKFSALRLADGTFWDEPTNKHLTDNAKAAHQSLIQAIVDADEALDGENNPVLRRLLLLMVLIKYLEDRNVFPYEGWFGKFHKGAKTFLDVLKSGSPEKAHRLLSFLERKFNGDVFALPDTGSKKLTKKVLNSFADLVEARTLKKQRYLWKQFSFKHLPVEIISHLYQRFVQGGHGTVYTPPFLAALLLDQTMPYSTMNGSERILDPACGSGVFLVGAYKKLINFWRSRNNWQLPGVTLLKKILKQSIFGIELDPDAIDLSMFSLCLALCDALQPNVIWTELKFDPLCKSNLFKADFFQLILELHQGESMLFDDKFDVIIGNPPFESNLTPDGNKVNEITQQQDKDRGSLPDKQTAYLFLEQSFSILNRGGKVCLIQPHGLLYNSNTYKFRTAIQKKYKFATIFDFISIRNLYEADPKTIAILAYAAEPEKNHLITHWTFRRTVSVHERICFEIDHYDRHRVTQNEAKNDAYVWRVNLLGGGRLSDISQRFRNMRTLSKYIDEQEEWDYGEGFIAGSGENTAPFLTGKKHLPTSALTDKGIDENAIEILKIEKFESPRNEKRFTPPLVLIKELASLPIAFWDKEPISYRDKIVGIHSPESQKSKLKKLYNVLRQNLDLYQFSCTLNGTQSLIGKATAILKQDIDLFPYPEDMKELSFSFWEKALFKDVLDYLTKYVRLGQNSELLKKSATKDNLQEYSNMFIRMLGSIYDNLQASPPIFLNGLVCQPFFFGEKPDISWLNEQKEDELLNIIYNDKRHESLRTIRLLRFYSKNVLFIIKPDRLRYWINSTAIRDADDTLVNLQKQGY